MCRIDKEQAAGALLELLLEINIRKYRSQNKTISLKNGFLIDKEGLPW